MKVWEWWGPMLVLMGWEFQGQKSIFVQYHSLSGRIFPSLCSLSGKLQKQWDSSSIFQEHFWNKSGIMDLGGPTERPGFIEPYNQRGGSYLIPKVPPQKILNQNGPFWVKMARNKGVGRWTQDKFWKIPFLGLFKIWAFHEHQGAKAALLSKFYTWFLYFQNPTEKGSFDEKTEHSLISLSALSLVTSCLLSHICSSLVPAQDKPAILPSKLTSFLFPLLSSKRPIQSLHFVLTGVSSLAIGVIHSGIVPKGWFQGGAGGPGCGAETPRFGLGGQLPVPSPTHAPPTLNHNNSQHNQTPYCWKILQILWHLRSDHVLFCRKTD